MGLKHRILIVVIAVIFMTSLSVYGHAEMVRKRNAFIQYEVVIDAGHGGLDGGVLGRTTHVAEAPLNLSVAKKLKECFEANGIKVIMVREDENDLCDESVKANRKRRDMEERGKIIKNSNAALMLSIHMNSYPDKVSRGGQSFYKPGCEESRELALCIQQGFQNIDKANKRQVKEGDFYILKQGEMPSVLVECGFLSHPEEEVLLQDENYQQKIAWSIYQASIGYLNKKLKNANTPE